MRIIVLKTQIDQIISKNTQWHRNAIRNMKLLRRPHGALCNLSLICPEHLLISPVPDVLTVCAFAFPKHVAPSQGSALPLPSAWNALSRHFFLGNSDSSFSNVLLVFITPFCMVLCYLLAFLSFPSHLKFLQGLDCKWFNFINTVPGNWYILNKCW